MALEMIAYYSLNKIQLEGARHVCHPRPHCNMVSCATRLIPLLLLMFMFIAIFVRINFLNIFFSYSFLVSTISTVLLLEGDDYTKLGLAVVVLILEGLHAVCYRRVLKDKNSSDHYQLCFISLSCSGRAWSWTGCVHLCSSTWLLSVLLFGFLSSRWQISGVQCTLQYHCQFNCHHRVIMIHDDV